MSERKDVYASMAPATYTRTLGSGVGRSPTTIVGRKRQPPLTTAIRRIRRQHRDGSKALTDGRARLETKLDPEVLEIFHGARAETKLRHVRTPAGVSRYHAPIGTPIVGGHAVPSLPSAGGGRMRAGGNAKRPTSGLIRPGGGSSSRGGSGGSGRSGGSRRGGLTGGSGRRSGGRRGLPGRGGHNLPGNGGGGGGGLGGIGGLLGGAGLGKLFGGGKKPPKGKAPPKPKKAKQPPKGKKPAAAKKGRAKTGTGKHSSTGSGSSSTTPKTGTGTSSGVSTSKLTRIAGGLVALPPDQLSTALQQFPYPVLNDLLDMLQTPQFRQQVAQGIPAGSKALADGMERLETKDRRPSDGTEACGWCHDPIEGEYDVAPLSKTADLIICLSCAGAIPGSESKVAEHSHMPSQLIDWWSGPGRKRWISEPHQLTSLHDQLIEHGVPARMAWGAASNIYHRVTGEWPANRPRALGGSTHGYAKGANALLEAKSRLG